MSSSNNSTISTSKEILNSSEANIPIDLTGFIIWTGPYGARHILRNDFWKRVDDVYYNYATANNIYLGEKFMFVNYRTIGKVYRIPCEMIKEFQMFVDTRNGDDHSEVDAQYSTLQWTTTTL